MAAWCESGGQRLRDTAVEAQLLVWGLDQLHFCSAHQFNPAGDVRLITVVVRQFQVALVVARFAFQQPVVEAAQLFSQMWHQRGKTFATARLDERPHHQCIHQLDRLVARTRRRSPEA